MYHWKTLQCPSAGHGDLNFHHGRHGNALGLLRLSLRESSSLRSSVNLTTSSQANLRDTEKVTKIRFSLPDHNSSINSLLFYLWGFTPDPMPKADIKTKKFCGIYVVILSEGNFPNPSVSGELQASRLPRLPWLKIPRQFSLHKAILNSPRLSHFSITYHLLRQFTTLPYRKCQTHSPFTPLMFCIKDIHYTLV